MQRKPTIMGYRHIENLYRPEGQTILLFRRCYALEKIHGTSAHLGWSAGQLHLHPGGESAYRFNQLFDSDRLHARFTELGYAEVTIHGEAYGGKQQQQAWRYGPELKFVAFDVFRDGEWLRVPEAEGFCAHFGIEFVHYREIDTDLASIDRERDAPSEQARRNSVSGDPRREGVVLRPLKEFYLQGERVCAKHKRDEERETASPRVVQDPALLQVLADAEKIASEWVTPTRLQHVLDKITSDPKIQDTPRVIAAMVEDVLREGSGEIVDSPEARKAISKATAAMFRKHVTRVVPSE